MNSNGGGTQTLAPPTKLVRITFDASGKVHAHVSEHNHNPGDPIVIEATEECVLVFDDPQVFDTHCVLLRKGQTALHPKALTEAGSGWRVFRTTPALRGDPPPIGG